MQQVADVFQTLHFQLALMMPVFSVQFSSVLVQRVMHVINVENTLGDEDWTGLAAAVAAWMASVFLSPAQKLFAGLFT